MSNRLGPSASGKREEKRRTSAAHDLLWREARVKGAHERLLEQRLVWVYAAKLFKIINSLIHYI
jgi:hypothetical protein